MVFAAVPLGSMFGGNIAELVLQVGPVGRMVLVVLLFFSVMMWAIIIQKLIYLQKSQTQSRSFQKYFLSSNNLTHIYAHCKSLQDSHLARLYVTGYGALRGLQRKRSETKSTQSEDKDDEVSITTSDIKEMTRVLSIKSAQEMVFLEKYLIFLATAGSAAPFIGLFGTVWGVMDAFRGLGLRSSASIGAVAPGISEALIATAAGLAVAIPAVIGYNYFVNKGKSIGSEMDSFSSEFLSIVERNFLVDG